MTIYTSYAYGVLPRNDVLFGGFVDAAAHLGSNVRKPGVLPGQKMPGGHAWRARRALEPHWGPGAETLVSQGAAGVRGKAPEAENLLAVGAQWKQQICSILRIL